MLAQWPPSVLRVYHLSSDEMKRTLDDVAKQSGWGEIKNVPLHANVPEECMHLGSHLSAEDVRQYKQQLIDGKIPCRTCQANAPDGIPARYCSDTVAGPFTFNGKCMTCPRHKTVPLVTMPVVPMEIPPPKSKLLVITVGVGAKAAELLTITGPSMQRYADRVGADFVSITGDSLCPAFPMMDKFRIYPYAMKYDRLLFIDADAYVRSDTPDLFSWYPDEVIAMHDDGTWNDKFDYREEARQVAVSQHEPFDRRSFMLMNSGVVLSSKHHADIWAPPSHPVPHYWCSEQHLITIRAINQHYPLAPLPRAFNWQWWANKYHPCPKNAGMHILHGAGFMNCGGSHEQRMEWLRDREHEDNAGLPSLSWGK